MPAQIAGRKGAVLKNENLEPKCEKAAGAADIGPLQRQGARGAAGEIGAGRPLGDAADERHHVQCVAARTPEHRIRSGPLGRSKDEIVAGSHWQPVVTVRSIGRVVARPCLYQIVATADAVKETVGTVAAMGPIVFSARVKRVIARPAFPACRARNTR